MVRYNDTLYAEKRMEIEELQQQNSQANLRIETSAADGMAAIEPECREEATDSRYVYFKRADDTDYSGGHRLYLYICAFRTQIIGFCDENMLA